jgi:hypothetical protein
MEHVAVVGSIVVYVSGMKSATHQVQAEVTHIGLSNRVTLDWTDAEHRKHRVPNAPYSEAKKLGTWHWPEKDKKR